MDNTLRDLQNSSYPTKDEFNNCFIIHSKYFLLLKGVSPLRSLFFSSPNITQPCPHVFSVNGSIICSGLHFWRHRFINFRRAAFLTSLIQYGEDSFQIWWTAAGYGELSGADLRGGGCRGCAPPPWADEAFFFFAFIHLILADQISCRSYVDSVYRMRSLAVSYSFASF